MKHDVDPAVEKGLKRSGGLLLAGLGVEAASLIGLNTPMGFMVFAVLGGALLGAGMLLFLWTVLRGSEAPVSSSEPTQ